MAQVSPVYGHTINRNTIYPHLLKGVLMKKYKDYLIYLAIIIIACLLPFILEYGLNINNLKNAISSEQNINMFQYLTYANGKIFILIYPVIVSYFSVKKFHQLYHSGMLTQICERTNYKKYLTDTFLKIYLKNSFMYFAYIWFMFIVCELLFKQSIYFDMTSLNALIFALISSTLSILFSIFIINISLITTRYSKKFSVTLIVSYLALISFAIISELFIGDIANALTNNSSIANAFSIFNMIYLDGNITIISIYAIILSGVSSLVVFRVYKDKEIVLREYE